MPRFLLALVSCLLLAGGASACGSAEVTGDVVPKSIPDLTPPPTTIAGDATAAADAGTDTGTTGATGATGADGADDTADSTSSSADSSSSSSASSGGTAATPAAPAATTPAPATPAPATPAPATGGGTATPDATAKPDANTGGASPGGLSDFCTQNPGACGQ